MKHRPADERRVPLRDREPLTWGSAPRPSIVSARGPMMRGAVLFYLGLGAAGAAWIHISEPGLVWRDRLLGPRPDLSIALGVAGGLLLVAVSRLLEEWRPMRRMQQQFAELLGRVTPGAAFLLALVSSVGEEILFRGAIQPHLGPWITSALFAVCHVPFDRSMRAWPACAFVAGLGLAFAAEWSGSLVAPILAHLIVNFLNLLHIARRSA